MSEKENAMSVGRMCSRVAVTIQRQATVEDAARLMRSQYIGNVIVVDPSDTRKPIGIITDRDVAINVVAQGMAPGNTPVGSVMSTPLLTVQEDEELMSVLEKMSARGVRRAPVVDRSGCLAGVISVDDLVPLLARELGKIGVLIRRDQAAEIQKSEQPIPDEFES
jgi:CBS domain-containing protein